MLRWTSRRVRGRPSTVDTGELASGGIRVPDERPKAVEAPHTGLEMKIRNRHMDNGGGRQIERFERSPTTTSATPILSAGRRALCLLYKRQPKPTWLASSKRLTTKPSLPNDLPFRRTIWPSFGNIALGRSRGYTIRTFSTPDPIIKSREANATALFFPKTDRKLRLIVWLSRQRRGNPPSRQQIYLCIFSALFP